MCICQVVFEYPPRQQHLKIDNSSKICYNNHMEISELKEEIKTIGESRQAPELYHNITSKCTLDKDHGRIEKREYSLTTDISWLERRAEWQNLHAIGMVRSETESGGNVTSDTRYFITSLTSIDEFSDAVRKHWSIENRLHWNLDVIFREDAARARKDNSPLNMNVLRKTALFLANQAKTGRWSKKKMMFRAAMNPQVLLDFLFPQKK